MTPTVLNIKYVKYIIYIDKNKIPTFLPSLPVNDKPNNKNVIVPITIKSINIWLPVVIGFTVEAIPNTNKILNILDPITLPKAISFSPF